MNNRERRERSKVNSYNYIIFIISILLLINVCFFDHGQNAGLGFQTKRSMASKKAWVYSQKIFYGTIILISAISIILNYFNIISNTIAIFLSIIGIILAGGLTQFSLIYNQVNEK
ncbi:putative membrane protein [Melissococcus plutonius]|nr:hypothetical protein [Melissococcus plutonius]AIM24438.2 putative membrane protein [Melissococcus plutonius S1]KMT25847.1 putative membrane protein [Melissococcus plutonius]KMT27192.1 putative membrane protein [Melissococcus plutonius]KMT28293.1 putative membrane protein [Melissococcus plutonius]KMT30030.1 putative membrane protein [Melissococcus plutonius]